MSTWLHVAPIFRRMSYANILEFNASITKKKPDGFS